MKAISLWNPWATLIALGAKTIETRSWSTSYRGEIAIHVAACYSQQLRAIAAGEPFYTALRPGGVYIDPAGVLGMVIATCRLVDCLPIHASGIGGGIWLDKLPKEPERSFGDYRPGRFAWILADVKRLAEPVPARGRQRMWNWTPKEVAHA